MRKNTILVILFIAISFGAIFYASSPTGEVTIMDSYYPIFDPEATIRDGVEVTITNSGGVASDYTLAVVLGYDSDTEFVGHDVIRFGTIPSGESKTRSSSLTADHVAVVVFDRNNKIPEMDFSQGGFSKIFVDDLVSDALDYCTQQQECGSPAGIFISS